MQVRVISPQDLGQAEIDAWRAITARQADLGSPYFTPNYAQLIASVRPHDSRVAVIEQDGAITGFLPFRQKGGVGMPLGAPMCDYQGLIAAPDAGIAPAALVRAMGLQRLDFDHWLTSQTGFAPCFKGTHGSHILDLSKGFSGYKAKREAQGSKIFSRAAKKMRRVTREIGPIRLDAYSRDRAAFTQMLAWKQAQYRATGAIDIFQAGWTLDVLNRAFDSTGPEFSGAFSTLHFADRLAATAFCLQTPRTLHGWFVSFEPELADHSPGQIHWTMLLEAVGDSGIAELDLGAGTYRFKQELATDMRDVAYGFIGTSSPASLCRGAQYGVRGLMEGLPLGKASSMPGKAMRRLDVRRALA